LSDGEFLERAKVRLDALDWYPTPVRIDGVRLHIWPWLFRLPGMTRFSGYAALGGHIILRDTPGQLGDDLICHELCHIWQMQHHPVRMPLSYLARGYVRNPYEIQARAVAGPAP
jgi:hypothetical protein